MARPWWERHPGRLEYELAALEAAGITPQVDEAAKAAGLLRMDLDVDVTGFGRVRLEVFFPDLYPYVRPEVLAPELDLPYHQHPFGKSLCLIGRSSTYWGTGDTLAWLLTEQLPETLRAGAAEPPPGPEREVFNEERQAEPFSDYYPYAPAAVVLIDSAWTLPTELTAGSMTVGVRGPMPPSDDPTQLTRCAVLSMRDNAGRTIITAEPQLSAPYPAGEQVKGRWVRLDAPPRSSDPAEVWAAAAAADPIPAPSFRSNAGTTIELRAVLFPEQAAWREASGLGWAFVVRRIGMKRQVRPRKGQHGQVTLSDPDAYGFVRAVRAGRSDLAIRVPELQGLADRHVVIAGVGALGSVISDQFARAGVGHVVGIDPDIVDAGNIVRHAAPFRLIGMPKALAVAQLAIERTPYVQVQSLVRRIGSPRDDPTVEDEYDRLHHLLADVDLLVDATAELGIQHLLADLAAELQIPYLCVSATNGGWGGITLLIRPGVTAGCYSCFLRHVADGTINLPPEAPTPRPQPPGCANPTFTGSGFDLDEISLQAVRTAAGLLAAQPGGYPPTQHDVAVLALRKPDGSALLPSWTGYPLTRHASCAVH